jgi:hypothetical protein
MAHNHVTGPSVITEEDIKLNVTLTIKDVGRWYIVINYHTHIVRDEEHGLELKSLIQKLH